MRIESASPGSKAAAFPERAELSRWQVVLSPTRRRDMSWFAVSARRSNHKRDRHRQVWVFTRGRRFDPCGVSLRRSPDTVPPFDWVAAVAQPQGFLQIGRFTQKPYAPIMASHDFAACQHRRGSCEVGPQATLCGDLLRKSMGPQPKSLRCLNFLHPSPWPIMSKPLRQSGRTALLQMPVLT